MGISGIRDREYLKNVEVLVFVLEEEVVVVVVGFGSIVWSWG